VILAPGTTAPESSATRPTIVARTCGWRITLLYGNQRFTRQMDSGVILAPPGSLERCGQINQEKDRPPEREPSDITP
jgi:hypothetical protein